MPLPGEPMWLPDDRDLALAWQRDHNARCGDCGMRRDEFVDEIGRKLRKPKWKVASRRCPACEAAELHDKHRAAEVGEDKAQLIGMKTVFVPADAD